MLPKTRTDGGNAAVVLATFDYPFLKKRRAGGKQRELKQNK
jgi:hypothetical protein